MDEALTKNNPQPSVTILMASYGRLDFLKEAVASALVQSYPNFKIIIVDDGSELDVIDWLRELESIEERVSVLYQDHQGVAAARANGVDMADTELICILDSDDSLAAEALDILVDAMYRREAIELVFCDIREVRASGEAEVRHYSQFESARAMISGTLISPRVPFKHSGTLFRRHTALQLGSYDVNLPCKVDVDLFLKFIQAGHLPEHVAMPLVDFRMHKNSVSKDRLTGIKVWFYLIDQYGPRNPFVRLGMKAVRTGAELLKRAYIEIHG